MEKRLNNKISEYTSLFKENIKDKATQLNIIDCDKTLQLIQYIYDYERLILNKEDLIKRKRVKNTAMYGCLRVLSSAMSLFICVK